MLFEPNVPNFDGFGVIANSDFPVPEAFIIKDIAYQNTFYNKDYQNNYHDNNNKSSWYEEDEDENEYDNYNEYNNYYEDEEEYKEEEYD